MAIATGNTKNFIGFTLDCKALGNILAQDPTALKELVAGIREAQAGQKLPLTTKLGAANLTGADGEEADWFGLFVSTVRDAQPGQAGLFYRNNTRGGKGDRIQMRLRRQPKRQDAQTPGAVLDDQVAGAAPNVLAQALALVQAMQGGAQGQTQVQAQPTTADDMSDLVGIL